MALAEYETRPPSGSPPVLARAVGDPGWRTPEPLDPAVVLPGSCSWVDLLVRGEDGGIVAYLTLAPEPGWARLVDIATAIAGLASPGCVRRRVVTEGRPPAEAVVEVRRDPARAGSVDVWLDGLDRSGSFSFTAGSSG